jgi:hypothetical protein
LMRQKFIGRIILHLWKDSLKDKKNMLPMSRISCWYYFVFLTCCIWVSWNTKWYQYLGDVGLLESMTNGEHKNWPWLHC